ncbi:MAG TPA: GNAT family N-acetyltransferase [Candidatus Dormibacteraeota bacterium]|nr:GNAT family N-acetyltransferase [Candidatus Dormibacteraeota bacterium]
MKLDFRVPSVELVPEYRAFVASFLPTDVDMWSRTHALARSDPAAYVEQAQRFARGEMEPLVKSDTYWVFNGNEMAAELWIRHHLRGMLLRHGGHVGYAVQPAFRGKGVATAMLRFALERLRTLGEVEALVTCDDDNPASARVIEKCGGVRIHDSERDGRPHRRYLIPLSAP